MSLLGAIVRTRPEDVGAMRRRLTGLPGLEIALDGQDGRLVLVLEDVEVDAAVHTAATTLERIAGWPEVLATSLVYEYSGADLPARTA